jgi:hypothetical protein
MFGGRSLERAVHVATPPSSCTPMETDAGSFACLVCNQGGTAGSRKGCGGVSIQSPRVMPTPMPIGSQSKSVAVGPMGRSVFRRRSQTGSVGLPTLSGNAVGGVIRHQGSNPSRSAFRLSGKGFGLQTLRLLLRSRPMTGSSDANGDADRLDSLHDRPGDRGSTGTPKAAEPWWR